MLIIYKNNKFTIKEISKLSKEYIQNLDSTMSMIFNMFEPKLTKIAKIDFGKIKDLFAKLKEDFSFIESIFKI